MSEISLDPTAQRALASAQAAFKRGEWNYVIDVTLKLLEYAPQCLPAWRMQRAAMVQAKPQTSWLDRTRASAAAATLSGKSSDTPAARLAKAAAVLRRDPRNTTALREQGEAALAGGWAPVAQFLLGEAATLTPADKVIRLAQGEACLAAGDPAGALGAADALLKLTPQDAEALSLMRKASIAQTMDRGKWGEGDAGSFRQSLRRPLGEPGGGSE